MIHRRGAISRMIGGGALLTALLGMQRPNSGEGGRPKMPPIAGPVLFNTPEADRIMEALQVFPPDNPWNEVISDWPVHPNSRKLISSIGLEKPLRCNLDMGYVLVPPNQKRVAVKLTEYNEESDPGPFPIPDTTPIEGWPASYRSDSDLKNVTLEDVQRDVRNLGGDRHAIVVDPVSRMLYEFYAAKKTDAGWTAMQTSIFDLKSNKLRPDGWTSSDAAGLPIFPSIVRYDEIVRGHISHALRVSVRNSRRAYVYPATHFASRSNDPNLPRMGERIRLKHTYDVTKHSAPVRTILEALQRHGMFVADNGLEWCLSVAPDERMPEMHEELRRVKGSDFEVVERPNKRAGSRTAR
jgi:hypothetical protein